LEHLEFNGLPGYRFFQFNYIKQYKKLEKIYIQRLKNSLQYLESKQRELKKQQENDTRSIESIIKYLKKDMIQQFKLTDYDPLIKHEIKNTDTFIIHVKYIIQSNFSNSI
jgi:hypothetical protein